MNQQANQEQPASSRKVMFGVVGGILVGISGTLLTFVAGHEGLRYRAYLDTGNVPTICYGHTNGVKLGDTANKQECEQMLIDDLQIAQAGARRYIKVPVSRNELDAYTDFVFNVGEGAFKSSTMLRKVNSKDRKGACNEFLRWIYVGKLDCRLSSSRCMGIPKRRDKEFALCTRPDSEVIQPWKP